MNGKIIDMRIVFIKKFSIMLSAAAITVLLLFFPVFLHFFSGSSINSIIDPNNRVIVVDAGHGGIDGGTSIGDLLEKEINLDIALRLKNHLIDNGYDVIMTREDDRSLEELTKTDENRHRRDLRSRVNIINTSNSLLFVSIHVNSHQSNPKADSSIVFYSDRFIQSKALSYCIQRSLNSLVVDGKQRTVHDPQAAAYYLLKNTNIPGVIVETAFISNPNDRLLLTRDDFKDKIAAAIASGIDKYYSADAHFVK